MEAGTGWVVKTASLAVGAIRGDLPFDGVRRKARGLKATRDMHEGVIYGSRRGLWGGSSSTGKQRESKRSNCRLVS